MSGRKVKAEDQPNDLSEGNSDSSRTMSEHDTASGASEDGSGRAPTSTNEEEPEVTLYSAEENPTTNDASHTLGLLELGDVIHCNDEEPPPVELRKPITKEEKPAVYTGIPRKYKILIVVAVVLWLIVGIIAVCVGLCRASGSCGKSGSSTEVAAGNQGEIAPTQAPTDPAIVLTDPSGPFNIFADPTAAPTSLPTATPTLQPTAAPNPSPTSVPTRAPVEDPANIEEEEDECDCVYDTDNGFCNQSFSNFLWNVITFNWIC